MLSKLRSMLPTSSTTKTAGIALAVGVIFLVVGYFIYRNMAPEIKAKTGLSVEQDNEGGSNTAEILFFYANWCPHCKEAKPHWERLKEKYKDKQVNGYNVLFTDVDCTKETDEIKSKIDEFEVEGYPTIKMVKGDTLIDFDAKPEENSLDKFLNTVL